MSPSVPVPTDSMHTGSDDGANRDVLREAPKERGKQVAMGAVLISTAGLAAVSASYALHLALHLWVPVAILGGLVWGLVILNLDRWLVVSTPRLKSQAGTLAMALPRVLLAVLIGAVVPTPLTLAVFSAEIETGVRVMAAETEDEFNRKLQEDSRTVEMEAGQARIAALKADLADGGHAGRRRRGPGRPRHAAPARRGDGAVRGRRGGLQRRDRRHRRDRGPGVRPGHRRPPGRP